MFSGLVARVADVLAHRVVVLLYQLGMNSTKPLSLMDAAQLEWQEAANDQHLLKDPSPGLVEHGSRLGPLRLAIGGQ